MLEQCTYSQDTAEDSSPTSSSDTHPQLQLSGMDMPAKSSENAPQMDGSLDLKSGTVTLDVLMEKVTPEEWIASMQDSLARICQSLESRPDLAKALEADCTEKSSVLLAKYDPTSCFLKTSQQSLVEDLNTSFQTWPRWGLMRDGAVFEHPMSEHGISVIDGSAWLPTIGANEYRGASKKRYRGSKDFRGAKMSEGLRTCETDPTYLHPLFGEYAMGFPTTWTELKGSETPKFPCKPQSPTACSEVSE